MTTDEFKARYVGMSEQEQIAFLCTLSHDLTISARDTYEAGTDQVLDGARLKVFNEAQHRLLGQLSHLVHHDAERYPDAVFAEIVFGYLEELAVTQRLESALATAIA